MIVNGIIAEYNPLHRGHVHQLQDAKAHTHADYTVIVMSGNFVQRGAPALMDKYTRTHMALEAGADLVLELPLPYAVSSAEYFASGAVNLLDKLGVVTHLCFGSEAGDTDILQEIAEILLQEPTPYSHALQAGLKDGLSYPAARTRALLAYNPRFEKYQELLSSPNNILAIEYLKALKKLNSNIHPYTTLRTGAGYADDTLGEISSALAIRKALFSGRNPEQLQEHLPPCTYTALQLALKQNALITQNDLSSLLLYKLQLHATQGYEDFLDVSKQLSDRIRKHLDDFHSFDSFCELLKTKEMTYTRISRCLLHILLDMKKEILVPYEENGGSPYARVLGFRKDAAPLLSAIKEHSSIPLITKLADAPQLLSPKDFSLLEQEVNLSQIYYGVVSAKSGQGIANEYRTPLVIL